VTANFYITSGTSEDNVLPQSILQYVVEARVEQELSKPYRFAVRFEEDICGEFLENSSITELQPGQTIAIIVKNEEAEDGTVLVRGPITKVKTSVVTGGAGSWYEIHGEDNRHLLDLTEMSAAYAGTASEQVVAIVGQLPFDVSDENIEQTIITYTEEEPLQQSGTDLAFLNKVARENNLEFWIEYEPVEGPFTDDAAVSIGENWFFRSSPRRPAARMMNEGPLSGAALDTLVSSDLTIQLLSGGGEHPLRVNSVNDGDCINVLSCTLDVDAERASAAFFTEVDPSTGELRRSESSSPQPPTDDADNTPPQSAPPRVFRHEAIAEPVGSEEEQRLQAEAALTEKSWFVKATCSTARHLFDRVLFPHQMVNVAGAGSMHSGTYQVTDVTHVVKPTAHMMDLKLRRNTINLSDVRSPAQGTLLEVVNG
jgi:hypothetical protein